MKYKLIVSILICTFILPATTNTGIAQINQDDSTWYPFYFPAKLDPNSPLNIGKLVLDAPAGKHGFVKVKNGHFFFEDGTRARFWGTNLTFNANFPDNKQAEIMANRIAFFGFNAVRLHHMDDTFEPRGIFKDIAPTSQNPQMKKTTVLSENQLGRLDYFIYLLKQRGIYIDMNLLVSRHFTEADGVVEAEKLDMAAKSISMFDPQLIKLQKQYAQDLLTHYNPYTKMRYCDDPVMGLIEITNENSLINFWYSNKLNGSFFGYKKDALPQYYVQQLDQLWNEWLKKKYGMIENVKKAWASDVKIPSSIDTETIADLTSWAIEKYEGAHAEVTSSTNEATLKITKIPPSSWQLQFRHTNISLTKNKHYLISFTAKADKPLTIGIVSQKAYSPWNNLGLSEKIGLTEDFQTYHVPFTALQDCPNAKFAFIIGYSISNLNIKNVSLKEITSDEINQDNEINDFSFHRPLYKLFSFYSKRAQSDIKNFYIELQGSYFEQMVLFLHNDLSIKIPITGIGGFSIPDDIKTEQSTDFIDFHKYWDQPRFPNHPWDNNDFRINNKSMLLDSKLGLIGACIKVSAQVPPDKPFTITEWNHCYPNKFAYETPLLIAITASKNDWDGLFQFDFTGTNDIENLNKTLNYFDIFSNSQQLILNSIASQIYLFFKSPFLTIKDNYYLISESDLSAAVGFIKGKKITLGPFTFIPSDNGAVILSTKDNKPIYESKELLILTVGEIKNENSYWNKNNKFEWGKNSVVLKTLRLENLVHQSSKQFTITKEKNRPWQIIQLI